MAKEQLGRYGENPHQVAWKEVDPNYEGPTVLTEPLAGQPLGFNNLHDANKALEVLLDLADRPAAVVIKHKNPCGIGVSGDLTDAVELAWRGDEVSAYGSFVGFSQPLTKEAARALRGRYVVGVVAPEVTDDALDWIVKNKKDVPVIATGSLLDAPTFTSKQAIRGGTLSQTADDRLYLCDTIGDLLRESESNGILREPNSDIPYRVGKATREPFEVSQGLVQFGLTAVKHTPSNAIIIAYEVGNGRYQVLGAGAGQPNRLDAVRKLAVTKAKENLMRQYFREHELDYAMTMDRAMHDSNYNTALRAEIARYVHEHLSSHRTILVSDAFFPKPDGLAAAAESGVRNIVQPGGSKYDDAVIAKADDLGVAMILTGIRHFRH